MWFLSLRKLSNSVSPVTAAAAMKAHQRLSRVMRNATRFFCERIVQTKRTRLWWKDALSTPCFIDDLVSTSVTTRRRSLAHPCITCVCTEWLVKSSLRALSRGQTAHDSRWKLMIIKTIINYYQLSSGWSNGSKNLVKADDSLPWASSVGTCRV